MKRAPRNPARPRYNGGGVVGSYQVVPGKRPRIGTLTIACPTCGAKVDSKCRSAAGNVMTAPHEARRRMATRRFNEERERP